MVLFFNKDAFKDFKYSKNEENAYTHTGGGIDLCWGGETTRSEREKGKSSFLKDVSVPVDALCRSRDQIKPKVKKFTRGSRAPFSPQPMVVAALMQWLTAMAALVVVIL